MQASSNALDIASIATGPKAVLSVKCLRMGMNTPIWRQAGLLRQVIAHTEVASKFFHGCRFANFQIDDVDLLTGRCLGRLKRYYFRYGSSRHRCCNPLPDQLAECAHRVVGAIYVAARHGESLCRNRSRTTKAFAPVWPAETEAGDLVIPGQRVPLGGRL